MSKIPKHTDGYIDAQGNLTIPYPNAVNAFLQGNEITVWVKENNAKGKLLGQVKIKK